MKSLFRQRGISLIEVLVTLVILALLAAAAGKGLTNGVLAYNASTEEIQVLGKLRYASERMVRETREIRRNSTNPAAYDITIMSPDTFSFTRADGIAVTLKSSPPLLTLAYNTPAGTYILTDKVNAASFRYYMTDTVTPASNASEIAFVEFELLLSHKGDVYPQRARVALRNQQ